MTPLCPIVMFNTFGLFIEQRGYIVRTLLKALRCQNTNRGSLGPLLLVAAGESVASEYTTPAYHRLAVFIVNEYKKPTISPHKVAFIPKIVTPDNVTTSTNRAGSR